MIITKKNRIFRYIKHRKHKGNRIILLSSHNLNTWTNHKTTHKTFSLIRTWNLHLSDKNPNNELESRACASVWEMRFSCLRISDIKENERETQDCRHFCPFNSIPGPLYSEKGRFVPVGLTRYESTRAELIS